MSLSHRRRTWDVVVVIAVWLAITLHIGDAPRIAPAYAQALPPDPQPLPPTGNCVQDNVFFGAIPPGGETAPVLVFVHGLSGLAEDWWKDNTTAGPNDMYAYAYNAGYRTAFVNLNLQPDTVPPQCAVKRRPANDMMGNGKILSQQLAYITDHYGVDQVDVIAHSKGGIDTQAAIVYWGAAPRVRRVITLATPHQGALLADLVCTPPLPLDCDQAMQSVRPASMTLFRFLTDAATVDDAIAYYSGAGDFWDTPGTIYELTGRILQNHPDGGDNDGAVTVASTALADASPLFLRPWNHAEIMQGHNAFAYIADVLADRAHTTYLPLLIASANEGEGVQSGLQTKGAAVAPTGLIIRYGSLPAADLAIPIEPRAHTAHFTLLATDATVHAVLIGPTGERYGLTTAAAETSGWLAGLGVAHRSLGEPAAGRWRVQLTGPAGTRFRLIVAVDSPLRVEVTGWPDGPLTPTEPLRLRVRVAEATGTSLEGAVSRLMAAAQILAQTRGDDAQLNYRFPAAGTYDLSIQVVGVIDGFPYERTFLRSLTVATPATLADPPAALKLLSQP